MVGAVAVESTEGRVDEAWLFGISTEGRVDEAWMFGMSNKGRVDWAGLPIMVHPNGVWMASWCLSALVAV